MDESLLNTAIAEAFLPAAYTWLPSGLTVTDIAEAMPSTPSTPSLCISTKVRAPVDESLINTAIAESLKQAS